MKKQVTIVLQVGMKIKNERNSCKKRKIQPDKNKQKQRQLHYQRDEIIITCSKTGNY